MASAQKSTRPWAKRLEDSLRQGLFEGGGGLMPTSQGARVTFRAACR